MLQVRDLEHKRIYKGRKLVTHLDRPREERFFHNFAFSNAKSLATVDSLTVTPSTLCHGPVHDQFAMRYRCAADTRLNLGIFSSQCKKGSARSPMASMLFAAASLSAQRLIKGFHENLKTFIWINVNTY